jgi:DNA-binding transcriptional MerR regulator
LPGTEKSDGAFRTIREVADWLVVPTHVLRFWESKFEQIAPVKGAGGRRYYRPDDMRLLGGIKVMLHDQGLTVRGVGQKIDDEGLDAVMSLSPDLDAVEAPPQRSRRVIRPGDEAAPDPEEKVVSFSPKSTAREPDGAPAEEPRAQPDEDPAEKTAQQPDVPTEDAEQPQPTDVTSPPQPVEVPSRETDDPPAPAPEIAAETAPGSDPDPVPTDERPVPSEPWQPTADATGAEGNASDLTVAEVTVGEPSKFALSALETRRLRRIVRKLRGLIEEVEQDLGQGGSR